VSPLGVVVGNSIAENGNSDDGRRDRSRKERERVRQVGPRPPRGMSIENLYTRLTNRVIVLVGNVRASVCISNKCVRA